MVKRVLFTVLVLILALAISTGTIVYAENSEANAIKSVTYELADDKIIFTVVTSAGNYSRMKVTTADNLSGSLGVSSAYTVDGNGDYVWTIKANAPTEKTTYAFDLRNAATGKYLKNYYKTEVEVVNTEIVKSVSYEIVDEKIVFTVVTSAGDYSRMKVTTADNLGGSLGVSNVYTVDGNGDYVWIIKAAAPDATTTYAFDLRNAITGKYLKDYSMFEVEIVNAEIFKSVSYEIVDEKIVFTVVTSAGDYSRMKVTTADNLGGSLGVSNVYTVDGNGDYVWTIKAAAPAEKTTYAFDLRNATTGKYLKDYHNFEVTSVEETKLFKSVTYEIVDEKIVFTVVTSAGDYSRIKVTTADNLSGSLGVGTYKVNGNGDYVWTVKANAPTEKTTYAFDLRNATTSKYLKDYYNFEVVIVEETELFKSATYEIADGKIVFTVVTSAGDYNRIKVTNANALSSSLGVGTYKVDGNGDYVWTVKANAPTEKITYAFDLRNATTGKYLKDYYMLEVEVKEEIASYTVTFKDWNGSVLKTETVEAGKSATAPVEPTRDGYTFVGWDKSFDSIQTDTVVTATYEQNITAPTLKVADVSAKAGQTVQLPINIVNNPGIAGAILTVSYDSKLTLSEAGNGEAFSFLQFSAPGKYTNPCKFAWDSEDGETKENGAVLYLTFEVPATAKSGDVFEISCSYRTGDIFNNNWDDVTLDVIGGTITVS